MAKRPEPEEWYAEGLQFECTLCGACCTGPPGLVEFTRAEGIRMARALGLTFREFLLRYARRTPEGWALEEVETPHGFDCVLLDRESSPGQVLCRVHAQRPAQCRTWPFWPVNLKSPRTWKQAGRRCEGLDRGPRVPLESIRRQRDETPGD